MCKFVSDIESACRATWKTIAKQSFVQRDLAKTEEFHKLAAQFICGNVSVGKNDVDHLLNLIRPIVTTLLAQITGIGKMVERVHINRFSEGAIKLSIKSNNEKRLWISYVERTEPFPQVEVESEIYTEMVQYIEKLIL